jgi:hypothetical protein
VLQRGPGQADRRQHIAEISVEPEDALPQRTEMVTVMEAGKSKEDLVLLRLMTGHGGISQCLGKRQNTRDGLVL